MVRGENNEIRKNWIFKRNSALNYLTMTKFHIGRLDLNNEKCFSAILELSIQRGGKGGKTQKFRIFEHNYALIYSTVKKFHMRRLDSNTKKQFSAIFEFSILRGRNR